MKTKQTSLDGLEDLFAQWRALLAARGVMPESEDALREMPPELARLRLHEAITRLGRSR